MRIWILLSHEETINCHTEDAWRLLPEIRAWKPTVQLPSKGFHSLNNSSAPCVSQIFIERLESCKETEYTQHSFRNTPRNITHRANIIHYWLVCSDRGFENNAKCTPGVCKHFHRGNLSQKPFEVVSQHKNRVKTVRKCSSIPSKVVRGNTLGFISCTIREFRNSDLAREKMIKPRWVVH